VEANSDTATNTMKSTKSIGDTNVNANDHANKDITDTNTNGNTNGDTDVPVTEPKTEPKSTPAVHVSTKAAFRCACYALYTTRELCITLFHTCIARSHSDTTVYISVVCDM
jgi:hypothetical protein